MRKKERAREREREREREKERNRYVYRERNDEGRFAVRGQIRILKFKFDRERNNR